MKRFMKCFAAVLVFAASSSVATHQAAAQQIPGYVKIVGKTANKIPMAQWGKAAIDFADEATRKDLAVISRVVERGFREKTQLVVAAERVDVVAEQTTSYWRGSVTQRVTMPCTATLALEVNQLLANATFNPATKTIEVYLPSLSIVAVEAHNSKYTAEAEYGGKCWEWYDSGTATRLELELLKSDWATLVRGQIDPNAHHLRQIAGNEATRILSGLLEPINPGLKIVVNQ